MTIHPEDNEIIELFNQGGAKTDKAFSFLILVVYLRDAARS